MSIKKLKLMSGLRMIKSMTLSLLFVLLLAGCASDVGDKFQAPKHAFGSANGICVVADQELWDSPVGDSIRYYFAAAYPILPQPEPIFDLRHYTPEELNSDPYRKELRSYLIVGDIQDKSSSTMKTISQDLGPEKMRKANEQSDYNVKVGYDKWAKGQILVYMFAQTEQALITALKRNYPAIANKFQEADKAQIDATIYFGGEEKNIASKIESNFGLQLRIPNDYIVAVDQPGTMWLRKETEVLSSNIFIHKMPYTSEKQLTKENIKAIRDTLGRDFVSTSIENTYMRTNDVDLPMITKPINLNGAYAIEARGIWDIVNDYMGGPFLGYLILNETKNELIYIDCFVHAPAKKKRDYIMHLEYIISSSKFL